VDDTYETAFDHLLEGVAADYDGSETLVAQWLRRGRKYDGDLLVVGRALNGWEAGEWTRRQGSTPNGREDIIRRLRADAEPASSCPMAWVEDTSETYKCTRSPFWRVTHRVLDHEGATQPGWASRLAWTNLYKVAPVGANPSAGLARRQREHCFRLLSLEVSYLRPRRVLALTDRNWFEWFEEPLGLAVEDIDGDFVRGVAHGPTTWVIARRPEAQPETESVAECLHAFGGV
jgi:hypothetical protein